MLYQGFGVLFTPSQLSPLCALAEVVCWECTFLYSSGTTCLKLMFVTWCFGMRYRWFIIEGYSVCSFCTWLMSIWDLVVHSQLCRMVCLSCALTSLVPNIRQVWLRTPPCCLTFSILLLWLVLMTVDCTSCLCQAHNHLLRGESNSWSPMFYPAAIFTLRTKGFHI